MPTVPPRPKIALGPSRHVYDVIVVGGQLGGALAAPLLAKRGYRVLLVEHDGLGPGYEHEGFLLPYAPFVAPQLRTMPLVEEAFAELGLNTTVQRSLKPNVPDLQLVLPQHRLDLPHAESKRLEELTREFGESGAQVNSLLSLASAQHEKSDPFLRANPELPPDGLMQSWRLKKLIERHPELEAPLALTGTAPPIPLLLALLPFVTYLAKPNGALPATRTLSQILHSSTRYPGGRDGLRELLYRRLSDLGGDLLWRESAESSIVEALSFEGGRVLGLKVAESENVYRCSCLIGSTDSGALRRLIPEKKKQRQLVGLLDLPSVRKFLFSVNWVLRVDALPRGMGDLLLMDTQEADLGPMLVQVFGTRRVGAKNEDESLRTICAAAFVPASARDIGDPHLQKLADRISSHLTTLIPFADQHRILVSIPYLHPGEVRGARLLPHPLISVESESVLGITGVPQITPVKNLFLANREVLPGLGLEGEFLAGIRAARLVQDMLKKRDPLKR